MALELFFLGSKQDSGNADRGLLDVPRSGNVLEGNFEVTPFAWSQLGRLGGKNGAGFPQDDLAKFVGEFDCEFDVGKRQISRIRHASCKVGDFLIQKILSAAKSKVVNVKIRRIGLFSRAEGKMRFAWERAGIPPRAGPHDNGQCDRDGGSAHPDNPRAASIWLRLFGVFDWQGVGHGIRSENDADVEAAGRQGGVRKHARKWHEHDSRPMFKCLGLSPNDEPVDQRFRQARRAHALLHRGDVVRNAPEFDGLMFEIGDSKTCARVAVARLADGTGI